MTEPISPLAQALIAARREGRLLRPDEAKDLAPAQVSAAMLAQRQVLDAIGASIAGWKVGYTPDGIPVAAPIYAGVTHHGGARLRHGPARKSGVEVEIALLLGKDLPPRPGKPYGRDDILDATKALFAGVEIVASRFEDPPKPPFLAIVADNINNGAYVRGRETADFSDLDLARLRTRLQAGGRELHNGVGGHSMGDPLIPVIDYANKPCDLLGGLKAGQFVTTGTLTGCPFLEGPAQITGEIEGLGKVELELIA
jgi:2-keto-4-pentenoate hydratase